MYIDKGASHNEAVHTVGLWLREMKRGLGELSFMELQLLNIVKLGGCCMICFWFLPV